jgi:hypothetical protein
MGRFITRDTWKGIYSDPITLNRWTYVRDNPVLLTDPSGHCDILCITAILIALGIITTTFGCSAGPEPVTCPPLPANLEPDAIKNMSPDMAISEIQNYFGIHLPPATSYVDGNGIMHSTSFKFKYDPNLTYNSLVRNGGPLGYTPSFHLSDWGTIHIGKSIFQFSGNNAYDIASTMVHEAYHAWQQYTFASLAQNPESEFAKNNLPPNIAFYTLEWNTKYTPIKEYQAYQYQLSKMQTPICASAKMKNDTALGASINSSYSSDDTILGEGLLIDPWVLLGNPLP